MPVKNGYAAMVRTRKPKSKRRKMDDYETPENVTVTLLENHPTMRGPFLEPAAGSGRIAKVIKDFHRDRFGNTVKVKTSDLKRGKDFLKARGEWNGSLITNPPYRDNLPEAFARKALEMANGHVALLVEGKWLWGSKRAAGLFKEFLPEKVIVLSSRIYFHQGSGKPITSQFFSHCWVIWPPRPFRQAIERTYLQIVDQNI